MICICENKDADQLRGYCEADLRLCFRYTDSTLPLRLKSEISSVWPVSVTVQPDLCQTCSETTLLVFSREGLYMDRQQSCGICERDSWIQFLQILNYCFSNEIMSS